MKANWKNEFPEFPAADMPDIPEQWEDSSWHNDACPSFVVMKGGEGDSNFKLARVWIAESDPAQREFPESPRFQVSFEDGMRGAQDELNGFSIGIASDDWQEILNYVQIRCTLAAEYVRLVGYNPFLDYPEIDPESVSETLAEMESGK